MIDVGRALAYLELDTSRFSNALNTAGSQMRSFMDSSEGIGTRLQGLGSGITTVGSAMTLGLSVPLVGLGATCVKVFGDFEESLNKVSTIADTSVMSMDTIKDKVLDLSNNIGVSGTELNEALYQTLSATGDTANALSYVETASKLAIGGFTSTTEAVDAATSVMNAYGVEGKEAFDKIADVMIQSQNVGKLTVGELSSSLYNVIPTAAAAGLSFEQVSAALAAITLQGTKAPVATTQVRQLLVELTKNGSKASEVFEKTAKKSFKEFIAEGHTLGEALNLMDEKAKTSGLSISDLFSSVEAGNAALQLTGVGSEKFADSLKQINDSAGATEEAFNKMDSGAKDSIEDMLNSLKNLGISFGELIVPAVMDFVEVLQGGIDWLNSLDSSTKKTIVTVASIVAAIGPVLLIVGQLFTAISSIINVASKFSGIGRIIGMAFNPVGLAIMAVIAIGALLILNWDSIVEFASNLVKSVGDAFNNMKQAVATAFTNMVTAVKNGIKNIIDSVASMASAIISGLASLPGKLFKMGKDLVLGLINGIKSMFKNAVKAAQDLGSSVANAVKSFFRIKSPSRLMMEYGAYIGEGLAVGITNSTEDVEKSTLEMISHISKMTEEREKSLESQIKLLEEEAKIEAENQKKKEDQRKISELKEKLDKEKNKEEKKKLQKQLDEELLRQEKESLDKSRAMKIESMKQEIEDIKRMNEEKIRKLDTFGSHIIKALENRNKEEERIQTSALDKEVANVRRATDEKIAEYDREYNEKLKILDEEEYARTQEIQKRIDGLNEQTEKEEKAYKKLQDESRLRELYQDIENAKSDEDRLKAKDKYHEELVKQDRERILEQRKEQIDAMKSEIDKIREQSRKKKDQLKEDYEYQKDTLKKELDDKVDKLNKEKEAIRDHYEELNRQERLEAEARRMMLSKDQQGIINLLNSYNPGWQNAGISFGQSLVYGLESMRGSVESQVSSLLSLVGRGKDLAREMDDIVIQAKREWQEADRLKDEAAKQRAAKKAEDARRNGASIGSGMGMSDSLDYYRRKYSIPAFASGAIVSRPMLAQVGDNPNSPEAITPLDKLQDFITNAVQKSSSNQGVTIQIDNMSVRNDSDINKIAKELHRLIVRGNRNTGVV